VRAGGGGGGDNDDCNHTPTLRPAPAGCREALTGSDQYMCEVCGRKCDADKRISIASLPEVLCIHLKRFSFHNWGGACIHGSSGEGGRLPARQPPLPSSSCVSPCA
jgi:hypothetical protein